MPPSVNAGDRIRAVFDAHTNCPWFPSNNLRERALHEAIVNLPKPDAMQHLEQDRDDLRDEVYRRSGFMERRGYRRCDIPACNCNSWHGGHMEARFDEVAQAVDP